MRKVDTGMPVVLETAPMRYSAVEEVVLVFKIRLLSRGCVDYLSKYRFLQIKLTIA